MFLAGVAGHYYTNIHVPIEMRQAIVVSSVAVHCRLTLRFEATALGQLIDA